jgi:hypothetical protein
MPESEMLTPPSAASLLMGVNMNAPLVRLGQSSLLDELLLDELLLDELPP